MSEPDFFIKSNKILHKFYMIAFIISICCVFRLFTEQVIIAI